MPNGCVASPGDAGRGVAAAADLVSANRMYALAAHRHMERSGTTSGEPGASPLRSGTLAQHNWAARNPLAKLCEPVSQAGSFQVYSFIFSNFRGGELKCQGTCSIPR
jgi:acetyl-CoA acetyltransferase